MNETKKYFDELKSIMRTYKVSTDELAAQYRNDNAQDKAIYSQEYYTAALERRKPIAQAMMVSTANKAQEAAKALTDKLCAAVDAWASAPVDQNLISRLQAIKTTGITLTEAELKLYAADTKGAYLPLRILEEIAGARGYIVHAPRIEDYRQDIRGIESEFSSLALYCGPAFELLEVAPNKVYNNVDMGRPVALDATIATTRINNYEQRADEMAARWADVSVSIEAKPATEQEQALLKRMFTGVDTWKMYEAVNSAAETPELRALIARSGYAEYLKEADPV